MASPQVAGMAALLAQYIGETGLAEQTGLTSRQLAQSLLMSTAVPQREEENGGAYYPILRQGAGLANVGAAILAESYLLMGEDATRSYADGKVKVELGDDPERTGTYQFSFSIHNLTDRALPYELSADFFHPGCVYGKRNRLSGHPDCCSGRCCGIQHREDRYGSCWRRDKHPGHRGPDG